MLDATMSANIMQSDDCICVMHAAKSTAGDQYMLKPFDISSPSEIALHMSRSRDVTLDLCMGFISGVCGILP